MHLFTILSIKEDSSLYRVLKQTQLIFKNSNNLMKAQVYITVSPLANLTQFFFLLIQYEFTARPIATGISKLLYVVLITG